MEMTLINIHALNAEKGAIFLAFPLFCLIPCLNNIILHLKVWGYFTGGQENLHRRDNETAQI